MSTKWSKLVRPYPVSESHEPCVWIGRAIPAFLHPVSSSSPVFSFCLSFHLHPFLLSFYSFHIHALQEAYFKSLKLSKPLDSWCDWNKNVSHCNIISGTHYSQMNTGPFVWKTWRISDFFSCLESQIRYGALCVGLVYCATHQGLPKEASLTVKLFSYCLTSDTIAVGLCINPIVPLTHCWVG